MKKLFITIMACLAFTCVRAQGWPANYGGVMLQGFYWDYYDDADWGTWSALKGQANDLEGYIDLIWVPNSARTKNDYCVEHAATEGNGWLKDMGYMPCWWLNHDNTIFGNTTDLKSMIATYKSKGIGIIEDVVINHKNGQNDWCDFPNEHVVGTKGTYDLNWSLADICFNDNGGYVRTMFDVTGAADTGDDFDGCRDLDHTGANVQKNVKTYLDYLQKELGYSGFRYDMVKGYGPQYVGVYNAYAKPTFSVGEFWDNWEGTKWWVDGTKQNGIVQSAAFDFPLKFLINYAFKDDFNQNALTGSNALAFNDSYKRYSVTFVDNHDTYRDGTCMSNEKHVLAANAFILSMPGTPCIFLPHWKTHKTALKRMIAARKAAGITNQSSYDSYECNGGSGRSFIVHGRNNVNILLLLGDCGSYNTSGYRSVWNGNDNNWDFQMFVSESVAESTLNARPSGSNSSLGTPRVDMPSGTYYQSVTVNVSPSDNFTTVVYTEDGNDPTTESSTINSDGSTFIYDTEGTHTLKVGVKGENGITNIQTYKYNITNSIPTDITIYVRADKNPIYLYAWDANGVLTSNWPGTQLTEMKSANGVNFYYMTFPKPSNGYTLNYILNQGSDDTKTSDQTGIGSDIFTALGSGTAENLTDTYTGATISEPVAYKDVMVYVDANRYPLNLYAWYENNENSTLLLGGWPGKRLSHTACINNKTWFYEVIKIQGNQSPNLIVSDGNNQSADFENVTGDVFVSYDGGDHTLLTNKTSDYAGYPQAWYEQGEICAFFVDDGGWGNIYAYAYNGNTKYVGEWPGVGCTLLGYNESGGKIWKWKYDGASLPTGTIIIFNNNGSSQTANCIFENGAWYNTSNTGEIISPISTAVTPSTEISVAALGKENPPTVTNWNGKSEKVAENDGDNNMTKDFSLTAGTYTVQAIVRGTSGSSLTLSAKGQSNVVNLTGLDGATSTVQTNGIVETYTTGTNNGWQKAEISFTLANAEKVTVTLSSAAEQWQLGALEMLPSTTKTKATNGVDLTNAYIDVRGVSEFSFFERGVNRNALIKAAANTLPALLPYNVIVGNTCANLQLTDGNYSFNNAGEAFTATNVSYDRPFTINQTSTVCLPFALTAKEADEAGTFWGLESYDAISGNVSFVEVKEPQANVPYLFNPAKANPFSSFTNKEIPATPSLTVTEGGISFVGVNERTNLKSVNNGVTYYGYKDNEFVKVGSENGAWINPFRAYIKTAASTMPARINVLFDGEGGETGIQVVKPAVEPKGEQPIYNLSGQRVQTPSMKGIYVKGGKKYIVK